MNRLDDWPERLTAFITERVNAPFEWGTNDCSTFAADSIQAITGVDPMREIRGTWNDAASAARMIERIGGIESYLEGKFSRLPNPMFSQRGDIALVPVSTNETREAVAVCVGAHWAAPGRDHAALIPLKKARCAFAVGRTV